MNRKIEIGDLVICSESGVIGKVLRFYTPTSCSEQTMVLTDDGRQYHAPTNTWSKCVRGESILISVDKPMNVSVCYDCQVDRITGEIRALIFNSLAIPERLLYGEQCGRR